MSERLALLVRQYAPKHTAKWFARALNCSVRSGKRWAAHPELFPRSRAEELLHALEAEDAAEEKRRAERRAQFKAIRRELLSQMGLDGAGAPLPPDRDPGRRLGGAVREGGEVVQGAGEPEIARVADG